MHLLVTRPQPEADDTARRLIELGHTVVVEPLLSVVFAGPPTGLSEPAALVVTSRNGVRALARWPRAADWRARPVFAVGEMTAEAARGAGFDDVRAGSGGGAALAGLVQASLAAGAGPIVHPAARDRDGALEAALRSAGYDVRAVEAYRAEPARALSPSLGHALERGDIDGALFYSRRTAEIFRELVAGRPMRLERLFALSEQVAAPLAGLGPDVAIARKPDEASLLALIPAP